jgi:DNA end-binding protein Ku
MARAMWKGAIQFGLVTIPVKLYTATEAGKTISFNMLHKKDLSRIQMKVYCPTDEEVIERKDTVRGYEYAPDQYVVITDEDLETVPLKTVRTIEIQQFVERESEDAAQTRFVERAYYIEPDPIGRKAFALLKSVLAEKNLTAIAKVVIKDREDLAAIDPFGPTMLLTTIKWPDEIRQVTELDLPKEEPEFKPAERKMAEQLVAAMTSEFNPEDYKDEYREALLKVIEAKVEGKETFEAPEQEEPTNLVDLMAALEASVAATKKARDGKERPVSVAEARERSTERGKAKAASPAARKRAADEEDAEEARPARRRKSA